MLIREKVTEEFSDTQTTLNECVLIYGIVAVNAASLTHALLLFT